MNPRRSPQRVRRRHLSDEDADLLIDRWTAVRSAFSNVGSIGGGASRDATARRCPAARAPTPCASSSRFAPRRSKTVGRTLRRAGGWSSVSSPSAAAAAPGSPGPVPDVRGAPTPARGRSRSAAPACTDRGWRRRENQRGRVLARVRLGVPGKRVRQDLDGNLTTQRRVRRLVHLPHSAFTDRRRNFVDAEARAGGKGQLCREYKGRIGR